MDYNKAALAKAFDAVNMQSATDVNACGDALAHAVEALRELFRHCEIRLTQRGIDASQQVINEHREYLARLQDVGP